MPSNWLWFSNYKFNKWIWVVMLKPRMYKHLKLRSLSMLPLNVENNVSVVFLREGTGTGTSRLSPFELLRAIFAFVFILRTANSTPVTAPEC